MWGKGRGTGRREINPCNGPSIWGHEPGTSIRNDGTDTGDNENTSACRRSPSAYTSISGGVLFEWLIWFGQEVPFYRSN